MSTIIVSSGQTFSGTVSSGQVLDVLRGGSAVDATILSGGIAQIRGSEHGMTINAGGLEYVYGSAVDTHILAGGKQTVLDGGSATSAMVEAGGSQHVSDLGTAFYTLVTSGGVENVTHGGTTYNAVVDSGGTQIGSAGAVVSGTVGSGGVVEAIEPGTVVDGTVLVSGSELFIRNLSFETGHTSATFDTHTDVLTVATNSKTVSIQLDGNYTGWTFTAAKTVGGTIVEAVPCYCRGTLILTDRGELPVEEIAIGDRLITLSGEAMPVKWIGRRSYAGWLAEGNADVQPIRFKAGSLGHRAPARDLLVSPEHAMFLDEVLVPAHLLVNGISVLRADTMEEVEYFHLELGRHAIIVAEGALSESFVDDDTREMFHNFDEYHTLYPNAPRALIADMCAPRVEDGYVLEEIRRKLMGRAVRLLPDGTAAPTPVMTGNLDKVARNAVEGWAFQADGPVALVIIDNGVTIGEIVADGYRADLDAAAIGNGRHGFRFALALGFDPAIDHMIEVRRANDWTLLPGAPALLKAEATLLAAE